MHCTWKKLVEALVTLARANCVSSRGHSCSPTQTHDIHSCYFIDPIHAITPIDSELQFGFVVLVLLVFPGVACGHATSTQVSALVFLLVFSRALQGIH